MHNAHDIIYPLLPPLLSIIPAFGPDGLGSVKTVLFDKSHILFVVAPQEVFQ